MVFRVGSIFALSVALLSGSPLISIARPDVILITVDTLRADRLRCYGYKKIETPNIDRLARDGIRFDQAIAECPVTLPSHCSILTGTYPIYHGVRDNSGYRLPPEQITLAEVLKQQGYRTGAFVGSYVLNSRTGLTQGFDAYVDGFESTEPGSTELSIAEHRAGQVMKSTLDWLEKARSGEPSFAWIHLFDPHAPYKPPAPYTSRYAHSPYDGEIAYADSVIGQLLSYLARRDLYERTLITLISDHGEGLGEHGEATHGLFLYDSTLRVPWILKPPEGQYAGKTIPDQVQSIDLMPTVLQFLSIQKPPTVQGTGLLALLEGKKAAERSYALGETLLPRSQYGWSAVRSVRSEEYKFIQAPRPELYDLKKDPAERSNLISNNQSLAAQLKQIRGTLASRYAGRGTSQARMRFKDSAVFQRLLGLGYVSVSDGTDRESDSDSLPDPKDKIEIFDLLWAAASDYEEKRYAAAVQKLKRVLATDPATYLARTLLGLTYFQMGSFPQASEELKASLSLRPADLVATFYLGMTKARMRDDAAAEQAFQKVLELDPGNLGAFNNLGIVYLNQKRFGEAAEIYRKLVALRPRDSFAWTNLGLAYMNQKRNEEAVKVLQKALEVDPSIPQIHNNLGLALMDTGQPALAIAHYRKALSLDPNYAQAHYNLAVALKHQGLDAEAEKEMRTARRLLPRQTPQ